MEGLKCGLPAGWPSSREVPNPVLFSPVTTGWVIVVLWDEPNVRRSWLKVELGQRRLKLTRCLNDSCTIYSTFDLIICHLTVSLFAKLFELYLKFLKNIILLFVVLSLLSCQTHPFSPQIFSNDTVRRSHFFVMA
jgi:hypothetical protein